MSTTDYDKIVQIVSDVYVMHSNALYYVQYWSFYFM